MKPSGEAAERSRAARAVQAGATTQPLDPRLQAAIDRGHLARMTLGDASLEREILGLFHHQSAMLLGRMAKESPRVIAALAHTLTGSARGIGAWQVAAAADVVARAASTGDHAGMMRAFGLLSEAVTEAQAAIAMLTRVC